MPFCVICERQVEAFLPHPNIAPASPFITLINGVGSDLEHYLCPSCNCNDRDRHLWLYMSRTGLLTQIDQGSILHIAPEVAVEAKLVATQPMQYICGDLFPKKPSHQRIDCESLPFPNNSFDLIISNHVLEHVANPDTALSEFFRTLKPNGYLIAQTPYAPTLKRTFELDEPTSPERAEFFYGQNDHVRLFGRDIVDYFRSAGFAGELYPHEHVLPGVDPLEYGCNGREPFFLFTKLPDA